MTSTKPSLTYTLLLGLPVLPELILGTVGRAWVFGGGAGMIRPVLVLAAIRLVYNVVVLTMYLLKGTRNAPNWILFSVIIILTILLVIAYGPFLVDVLF